MGTTEHLDSCGTGLNSSGWACSLRTFWNFIPECCTCLALCKVCPATVRTTLPTTSEQPVSQGGLKFSSYDRIIHETKTQEQRVIWSAYTNEAEHWWDNREGDSSRWEMCGMSNPVRCLQCGSHWEKQKRQKKDFQHYLALLTTANCLVLWLVQKRLFTSKNCRLQH